MIFVRDPRLIGRGEHFLLNQVAPFEYGILQAAVEHAELHAWKRNFEPHAVRFHVAPGHVIYGRGFSYFFGLARESRLVRHALGRRRISGPASRRAEIERRIPERLPPVLVDDVRRKVDAQSAERRDLLIAHASQTGHHAKIRSDVGRQHPPRPAAFAHGKLLDSRNAAGDDELEPQRLAAFGVPRHRQPVDGRRRRQSD